MARPSYDAKTCSALYKAAGNIHQLQRDDRPRCSLNERGGTASVQRQSYRQQQDPHRQPGPQCRRECAPLRARLPNRPGLLDQDNEHHRPHSDTHWKRQGRPRRQLVPNRACGPYIPHVGPVEPGPPYLH